MFKSARIRLTGLYIIIVTFVGIIFSSIIYRDFVMELHKNYAAAEYRLHNQITISPPRRAVVISLLAEDFEKSKKIVFLRLLAINGFVISVSGIAAYFLAGKTLQPIELAVEDQKRFVSDASHELRTPLTSMKSGSPRRIRFLYPSRLCMFSPLTHVSLIVVLYLFSLQ